MIDLDELVVNPLEEVSSENNKIKDIKKFFDLANDNVKSATEIFNKCVDMKKKIDQESKALDRKKIENEESIKQEVEKVNRIKEVAFSKLKERKAEIDIEASEIKQEKILLSNEKSRFEMEKKKEYMKFEEEKEKQRQFMLEKNKELDKLRNEIEQDRIKLEEDKIASNEKADELSINLTKFNEIVKQFTSGIEDL